MGKHTDAFIVPAGLVFEQVDEGLAIEHEGDVILHSTLGLRIHRIRSNNGNISIHTDLELDEIAAPKGVVAVHGSLTSDSVLGRTIEVDGTLSALGVYGGAIRVAGDIEADNLTAEDGGIEIGGNARVKDEVSAEGGDIIVAGNVRAASVTASRGRVVLQGLTETTSITAHTNVEIHGEGSAVNVVAGEDVSIMSAFQAQSVRARRVRTSGDRLDVRMIQAGESIHAESVEIQADLFIAPEVELGDDSAGRITVVESHNQIGPTSVKGCLRLEHLEQLLGSVDGFLAERGVDRLPDPPEGRPAPRPSRSRTSSSRSATPSPAAAPSSGRRSAGRSAARTRNRAAALASSRRTAAPKKPAARAVRRRSTPADAAAAVAGDETPAEQPAGNEVAAAIPAEAPAAPQVSAADAPEASVDLPPAEPVDASDPVETAVPVDAIEAIADPISEPAADPVSEADLVDAASPEPLPEADGAVELPTTDDAPDDVLDQAAEPTAEVAEPVSLEPEDADTEDTPMPSPTGPTLMVTGADAEDLFDLDDILEDEPAVEDEPAPEREILPSVAAAVAAPPMHGDGAVVGPPLMVDDDDIDAAPDAFGPADETDSVVPEDAAILAELEGPSEDVRDDRTAETVFDFPTAPVDEMLSDANPASAALPPNLAAAEAPSAPIHLVPPRQQPTDEIATDDPSTAGPLPDFGGQDPIHMLMMETVGRMVKCYATSTAPPSVARLEELVAQQDYETIRAEFNTLYTDLQAFHREHDLDPPHPRVSHTFRTIDTIVRNL